MVDLVHTDDHILLRGQCIETRDFNLLPSSGPAELSQLRITSECQPAI